MINNGATYTNTTVVTLSISATDNSTKKMRFKNSGSGQNYTDWADFQSSRTWNLTTTDGSKTVYFQCKDIAGNIATAVSDGISLDTTKPSNVGVSITGKGDTPSTHTNDPSVTLGITAEDATSALAEMMISNSISFEGASWETYSTSKTWTLNTGDGTKTVYLKVKDNAGLISDAVSNTTILDTTAPTGLSISINSGQSYTNSTNVTLTLAATNATKMQFSNNGTSWSSWETYATSKTNWPMTSTTGTKKVYFRAKDIAGNTATAVNDTITLDTTAPSISSVSSTGVSQSSATITWTTNEIATSYVEYGTTTSYGSNTTLNTTKVTSHSQTITGLTSGATYHYRVSSSDSAGNSKTSADYDFTTSSGSDSTAPDAITGVSAADKPNAEKTITITWDQSSATDFEAYYIYRSASGAIQNVSGKTKITTITSKTTTTYDDTSATDGTTFYYAVTAVDTATPPNENQTISENGRDSATSVDDKAPTTTDNIPVGWQTSSVTVLLTATDNGKGVMATWYTIDGSNPTNVSNSARVNYTSGGQFPMTDGKWTIKYYSYDKNTTKNNESIHTKTLNIDTLGPVTNDTVPIGWQNTSVTITLFSNDDTTLAESANTSGVSMIYYTKDESIPTTLSFQYSNSSKIGYTTDGIKTLKYRAKDNATNWETTHTQYIYLDTTRPTSSVTTLSAYSTSPFNVSWTSSDATSGIASVVIQVKNGTSGNWTNWLTGQAASGTSEYSEGANGSTYYFRSIATDNASNTETDYTTSGDTYTTVSSGVPTATISSPSDDAYVRQTVTFTGDAYDADSDIVGYWLNYTADGSSWNAIESGTTEIESDTLGTLNTSSLTDGDYNVSLYVLSDSNYANWMNITLHIDNTDPNISSVSAGSLLTTSAVISWTTNEAANSTVEYGATTAYGSLESSGTYVTTHSVQLTSLTSSTTYHYRVSSYDQAGNSNTSLDGTFTTATPEGGGGGGDYSGGDDDDDDDDDQNETTPTEPGAPSITNVYHIPSEPTSSEFIGIYATVTAVEGYTISSVTLQYNDGSSHISSMTSQGNGIYFAEIGPFADGTTVSYYVTATDNASTSSTSSSGQFSIVDNAGPTISGLQPNSGTSVSDRTPTMKASYSDPAGIDTSTVTITIDGTDKTTQASVTASQVSYTPSVPMSLAQHTITVTATDTNGNANSRTWSFSIVEVVTTVNETIENVTAGETATVNLEETETGLESIRFTASINMTDVSFTVEKYEDLPGDVPSEPNGTIYAYLHIETTAQQGEVESFKVTFKVSYSWLIDNEIDKEEVLLLRYHDDEWQEISTTILNEDSTYVYYEAEITGFSYFAIAGNIEQAVMPAPPWVVIIGAIMAFVIVTIVILFKAGFIYVEDIDDKKPKKK